MDQRVRDFIVGLEELSRKHGVYVGGCGCCGSPYVQTEDNVYPPEAGYMASGDGNAVEDLKWTHPEEYYWKQGKRPIKAQE